MNLIPTVGADDVPFGTLESALVELLGVPNADENVMDFPEYPATRRLINYAQRCFLVIPEHGVVMVMVEASDAPVVLWGKNITEFTPGDLRTLIEQQGFEATIDKDPYWGDCDVNASECGIVAWFLKDKLKTLEMHNPAWETTAVRSS